MHEVSLIRNVFGALESEFSPEEVAAITVIELKVGDLANVEPILMQNAFSAVTEAEGRFQQAELRIIKVPVQVQCEHCGTKSIIRNYKFICSNCQRPTKNMLTGTELLIHRVHFAEDAVTT